MKIEIIRNLDCFLAIKDEWNLALQKSPSNTFFLRHEWLSGWWKNFGGDSELFIVVIRQDGQIAAAAPMMILKKTYFGIMRVNKLQFIAHEVSDYMDFIIVKGYAENFSLLIKQIVRHSTSWDWAEFLYIPESSAWMNNWREIASDHFELSLKQKDLSVVIDIANYDSYDGYFRSLSKKVRFDINRQTNNIKKLGSLALYVYTGYKEIEPLLDDFFILHRKKWEEQKHVSQFNDKSLKERYKALTRELDGSGILEFSCLRLGEDIIAMHYGFVYGQRYYWYTPTYNPQYYKYSPGKLLLAALVEGAIKRGLKTFDLLRGEEKYKYYWAKTEIKLYSCVFLNKKISCRAKYFLAERVKDLIKKTVLGQHLQNAKKTIKLKMQK